MAPPGRQFIPRIYLLFTIGIILFVDITYCKPYQLLKHKDGYIAVFIRHGDEPLANIDPVLAEAFNEKIIESGVVPIEHQNLDTIIAESSINNEKLSEITLSNINKNNHQ